MPAMILLKYKKRFLLSRLYSYAITHPQDVVKLIFLLLAASFGANFFLSFRIAIILLLIATAAIFAITRNLFLSSFIIAVFSLPLFSPNKLYPIIIIQKEMASGPLNNDYIQSYGLFLPNIFILLSFFSLLPVILKRKTAYLYKHRRVLFAVLGSFFVFFLTGLYSSVSHSPFFSLSFVWLLQYMQVVIVTLALIFIYLSERRNMAYVYIALSISILAQSLLIFWQFIRQGSSHLLIESRLSSGLPVASDANISLFRPSGTFLHPNQAATIILVSLILFYPLIVRAKNLKSILIGLIASVAIILTQSREAWFMLVLVGVILAVRHRQKIGRFVYIFGIKRIIIISIALLGILSFVLVPRLLLLNNIFNENGAIPTRVEMIKEGMDALFQSPWFGYGVGTNEHVLYLANPDGIMSYFPAAIHMAYLQLALEVGIIGLAAFALPFFLVLRSVLTGHEKNLSDTTLAFILSLLTFGLYFLFQAHIGIFDFAYLGLILGFGLISIYEHEKNH